MILDSATLYYRAFYALPEKMTAPDGRPHNAIRGFLSMVSKLVSIHSPSGLVAAWDTDWRPEWRVALLPSYKAHRVLMEEESGDGGGGEDVPDTLSPQISAIAQILDACGVARIGFDNFEADDVIASVAAQSRQPNLVVTSDKDLIQVIDDRTSLLLQTAGGVEGWPILDPDEVLSRFGVKVNQYVDYAILRGDPSDGLPGVAGVGEKTAASLIAAFGTIDRVKAASFSSSPVKPMTARIATRIQESVDYLDLAKEVVTAEVTLPVHHWEMSIPLEPLDPARLKKLGDEWGVTRYIDALFTHLTDRK